MFDLHGRDGKALAELMESLKTETVSIDDHRWKAARKLFDSHAVDDEQTCKAIKAVFDESEELLDPHTAIGVVAARECRRDASVPMVTLATAHPVKFPEAVEKSGVDVSPELPHHMADLFDREESYTVIENNLGAVQSYVKAHGNHNKSL